jgi:cyclase
VKKRIILGLLFDGTHFYLSRNFRLQKLGDLDWLQLNFQIFDLASHVDEIAVFHVRRTMRSQDFGLALQQLTSRIFVPVSVGGGLQNMQEVDTMFRSGADRIMFSNSIWTQPELIRATSQKYGAQATMGVVNFLTNAGGEIVARRVQNGTGEMEEIGQLLAAIQELEMGELVVQSVDRDGTGQGFPISDLGMLSHSPRTPVIAAGGFGSTAHVEECLVDDRLQAVLTSNLLAFLGDGLSRARNHALRLGVEMARWEELEDFF